MNRFEWGCKDGDHRGWAIVDAEHKFAAQALVPRVMHPYTRIVELTRFNATEALREGGTLAITTARSGAGAQLATYHALGRGPDE